MKKKVLVVVDTGHIWGIELAAMRFQLGMNPDASKVEREYSIPAVSEALSQIYEKE